MRKTLLAIPLIIATTVSLSACGSEGKYDVRIDGQQFLNSGYKVSCEKEGNDSAVAVYQSDKPSSNSSDPHFSALLSGQSLTSVTTSNGQKTYSNVLDTKSVSVSKDGKTYKFTGKVDDPDTGAANALSSALGLSKTKSATLDATITCP